jgi:hypothetical protein
MSTVFAITQPVFLTLGTNFLKGMVNANGNISSSFYSQFLDRNWPWLFLITMASMAYALISYQINRSPFTPAVARIIGVVLSGMCFVFFVSVYFFPSA